MAQTNKRKISQSIAEDIYWKIQNGTYDPGCKLPTEKELGDIYSASRTPIREAIQFLSAQGIVNVVQGSGVYVKEDLSRYPKLALSEMMPRRMHRKELQELRLMIEPNAAALACIRATDAEIAGISEADKRVQSAFRSGDKTAWLKADQAFHRAVLSAAHNVVLEQFIPVIFNTIDESFTALSLQDEMARDGVFDHAQIAAYIQKREAVCAKRAMYVHLYHLSKWMGLIEDVHSLF